MTSNTAAVVTVAADQATVVVDQAIQDDPVVMVVIEDQATAVMVDMAVATAEDGTIDSHEVHGDIHSHEVIHQDVGDSVTGGITGGIIDGHMTHGGIQDTAADSQATAATAFTSHLLNFYIS